MATGLLLAVAWLSLVMMPLAASIQTPAQWPKETQYWWDLGQNELASALNVRDNWNVAKNVIMFLGDGMGITANVAARIYKGQKMGKNGEEGYLEWERFPNAALLKTYNVDRQVPDSAGTATAYLSGVKTNSLTLGVNEAVQYKDCAASKDATNHVTSILQWAQEAGMDTGLVTTTRITHATPAALYSHSASRRWESDVNLGEEGAACRDIAKQLICQDPGRNIKVILGGGRLQFGAGLDPESNATREDGLNLTEEWLKLKMQQGCDAQYVTTAEELMEVNTKKTDYLLGLFSDSHLPFVAELEEDQTEVPSLKDMTLKAIQMLQKNKEGFFLLVEGGRIDHGLHANSPHRSLEETVAMDSAVAAALKAVDLEETLLLVTADHSHVLTINGYPVRGNDILGVAGTPSRIDGLNYTTLMFTNGPGYNYTVQDMEVTRQDPSEEDTRDLQYKHLAAVPKKSETHGGEDVAVWAAGPMAHLFHRTHEQHYVAHVMGYAACVGPSAKKCDRPKHATFTKKTTAHRGQANGSPAPFWTRFSGEVVPHSGGPASRFPTIDPSLQKELDDKEREILEWVGSQRKESYWDDDLHD